MTTYGNKGGYALVNARRMAERMADGHEPQLDMLDGVTQIHGMMIGSETYRGAAGETVTITGGRVNYRDETR